MATYRMRLHPTTTMAIPGDLIQSDGSIEVASDNVQQSIEKVILPLFGPKIQFPRGVTGEFYASLLQLHGVTMIDGHMQLDLGIKDEDNGAVSMLFTPGGSYRKLIVCDTSLTYSLKLYYYYLLAPFSLLLL